MFTCNFKNKENHINCKSEASRNKKLELLIDTGSEVNITKINTLNEEFN